MGWIIGGFTANSTLIPILYFRVYSIIIAPIFIILNSWKTLIFSQIPQIIINSLPISIIFSVAILSLGGLPPLTGFIPKWVIIILLRPTNWVLVLILIIGRLINLYFYLNLTFNMLTTSLIHNTHRRHRSPKPLRLIIVLSINRLGILPIILYAMTLLY
jgi:NADH-ubiquinone oxidoreductase chain 2